MPRLPNMSRSTAADVFHAIADPTRRQILDALAEGAQPVNRLLPLFQMSQPAVSQHLRVLREVGLVTEHRAGRQRIYSLSAEGLAEVARWVTQYERFWNRRLDRLAEYLDRTQTPAVATRKRRAQKGKS
jgi:DNA-binding transcriptional ArsR family regulator